MVSTEPLDDCSYHWPQHLGRGIDNDCTAKHDGGVVSHMLEKLLISAFGIPSVNEWSRAGFESRRLKLTKRWAAQDTVGSPCYECQARMPNGNRLPLRSRPPGALESLFELRHHWTREHVEIARQLVPNDVNVELVSDDALILDRVENLERCVGRVRLIQTISWQTVQLLDLRGWNDEDRATIHCRKNVRGVGLDAL